MTAMWAVAYPDSGGSWPCSHVVSPSFIGTSPERPRWMD